MRTQVPSTRTKHRMVHARVGEKVSGSAPARGAAASASSLTVCVGACSDAHIDPFAVASAVVRYTQPRIGRGLLDILTCAGAYLALCGVMYLTPARPPFACGCARYPDRSRLGVVPASSRAGLAGEAWRRRSAISLPTSDLGSGSLILNRRAPDELV